MPEITGQQQLLDQIEELTKNGECLRIHLTGPSGVGKSWVAERVSSHWLARGSVVFTALGSEQLASRPRFPLLMAVSTATRKERAEAVRRVAIEPVSAIPLGGKALRELLKQLFERQNVDAISRTPFLHEADREILMRMQKVAGKKPCLLICDNIQWWDEYSLQTLRLSVEDQTRSVFPFLENLSVIIIETTESTGSRGSGFQRVLSERFPWKRLELKLCNKADFGNLLKAFGIHDLPDSIAHQLFVITGGHLELVKRMAEARAHESLELTESNLNRADFLFELLEKRLNQYSTVPEATTVALRTATVIGVSFSIQELSCLLGDTVPNASELLEPAERLRLLDRSGELRVFTHNLVYNHFRENLQAHRQLLHARFAECLRLVHAGDYARRCTHLRLAGNQREASEILVLECLRRLRSGDPPKVERLPFPLDDDHRGFLTNFIEAQSSFEQGSYAEAISALQSLESLYGDALLAERDILIARSYIKTLSSSAIRKAIDILTRWQEIQELYPEIWGRIMIYLMVAYVFLGDEFKARQSEQGLQRSLAKRIGYDPTVLNSINHLRLKSNMLHSNKVARERLLAAIDYFAGEENPSTYDPIHLSIGLSNLAANYLVEGESERAYKTSSQALTVIQDERDLRLERLDIIMTNLNISSFLSNQTGAAEALKDSLLILKLAGNINDRPLLETNVCYFLAQQGRYQEAVEYLEPIFRRLLGADEMDSYYLYLAGNNFSGALFESGRLVESEEAWRCITPYADCFVGPQAAYMKRRQELQGAIFSSTEGHNRWDSFLGATVLPQVGPGWRFYGFGFLPAELEFWSDE